MLDYALTVRMIGLTMATAVLCRGCGVKHDPLQPCPSKDAIITMLRKLLAETEATLGIVRRELIEARSGKAPFDRVAYQREYMRKWRKAKNEK